MASRKMKLKKEHTTFNIPIQVISEQEAKQRIIDSLLETKQDTGTTEASIPADNNLQSAQTDSSGVRTFTGIAYSGKPIEKHFMFENLFLDVEGMNFKEQIPIFKNHNPADVVGFGKLRRENGQLLIDGTLATELDSAKEIAALSDAGFAWELSVGVEPEFVQEISSDVEFSINGVQAKGPAMIFRSPTVMETSFVPIGADRNTSAEVFNKDLNKYKNIEVRNMDITTIKVDGKDVEFTKNDEGKFSISLDVETLEEGAEYTFCPCMEGKELSEEDDKKEKSLADENAALLEEIAELRAKNKEFERAQKKARFSKAVESSSIELGEEEFETLLLLPEDKFESFLNKIENTKVTSNASGDVKAQPASKELFKQDAPAQTFSDDSSVEEWKDRARSLQKEFKEKGVELSFKDAMSRLMAN